MFAVTKIWEAIGSTMSHEDWRFRRKFVEFYSLAKWRPLGNGLLTGFELLRSNARPLVVCASPTMFGTSLAIMSNCFSYTYTYSVVLHDEDGNTTKQNPISYNFLGFDFWSLQWLQHHQLVQATSKA